MAKDKGGRPRYKIDYATLDSLCGIMCTGEEIAALLDVDYDTLDKNLKRDGNGGFTEYYKKKSSSGKMSLRRKQYTAAMEGNVTMLVWLGKQHLDQSDRQQTEVKATVGVMELKDFYGDT